MVTPVAPTFSVTTVQLPLSGWLVAARVILGDGAGVEASATSIAVGPQLVGGNEVIVYPTL